MEIIIISSLNVLITILKVIMALTIFIGMFTIQSIITAHIEVKRADRDELRLQTIEKHNENKDVEVLIFF